MVSQHTLYYQCSLCFVPYVNVIYVTLHTAKLNYGTSHYDNIKHYINVI